MKISCPSCSARYAISDDKLQGKVAKIRCRQCSAVIQADGRLDPVAVSLAGAAPAGTALESQPAPSAPEAATGAETGSAAGLYSVDLGDAEPRDMSIAELVQHYQDGVITAETYLWTDGMDDWRPLAEIEEIVVALHAAAGSDAMDTSEDVPFSGGHAESEPVGFSVAEEPAFRAPEPAAFSFGAEPSSAPEPEPTGARDEASVLFSLAALASSSSHGAPNLQSSAFASRLGGDEDSGLIDLKALAVTPADGERPSGATVPVTAVVPGITLGQPPPPAPKKTGYALVAAAILVVGGMIAFALAKSGKPEEVVPAKPAVTELAPPTVVPPAPTPPTVTPVPEKALPADAAPAGAPTKRASVKLPGSGKQKTVLSTPKPEGKDAAPKVEPEEPKDPGEAQKLPAKSKNNKCGCAPGDLQCAIACAAKK